MRARIVVNRNRNRGGGGHLQRQAELAVKELAVAPGDTVDFMVDCMKDAENDGFEWAPVISAEAAGLGFPQRFRGSSPSFAECLGEVAQVLLQTSEFAFVD